MIQVVYMSRNVEQVFLSRLSAWLMWGHGRFFPLGQWRFQWNKIVEYVEKHVELTVVKGIKMNRIWS